MNKPSSWDDDKVIGVMPAPQQARASQVDPASPQAPPPAELPQQPGPAAPAAPAAPTPDPWAVDRPVGGGPPPPTAPPAQVPGGLQGALAAGGNAVWQGITLGMGAELDALAAAISGQREGESFGDAYGRSLSEIEGKGKALREQNPVVDAVGFGVGMAPGMVAGPVTRGAGALYGGVTGAIEGASEGTTPQRLMGAGVGGAAGAAGGFFGPEIGRGVATVVNAVRSRIPVSMSAGLEQVAEALLQRGVDPAEAERRIVAAAGRGQPLTLGDIGEEPAVRLATRSGTQSVEGDALLREAAGLRTGERADRVTEFLSTLSPGQSTAAERELLQRRARAANQPAYRAAYDAVPSLWDAGMQDLTSSDAVRRAISQVERASSDRAAAQGGRAIRNPFTTAADGSLRLTDPNVTPSLEFWDQVQRNLREQAEGAGGGGLGQRLGAEGTRINEVRNTLMGRLRAIPEYDRAIGQAASFFGEGNALDWGKQLAGTTYDPETFQKAIKAVGAMNPDERRLAQSAYLDTIAHRANEVSTNSNVAQRQLGSANDRRVVEALFGKDKAELVNTFVDVENLMARFDNRALGGSQTSQRMADRGAGAGAAIGPTMMAGGGAMAAQGVMSGNMATAGAGAGAAAAGLGLTIFNGLKNDMSERTAKIISERLISQDPAQRRMVYQIMQSSPRMRDNIARAVRAAAALGGAELGQSYGGRNAQ